MPAAASQQTGARRLVSAASICVSHSPTALARRGGAFPADDTGGGTSSGRRAGLTLNDMRSRRGWRCGIDGAVTSQHNCARKARARARMGLTQSSPARQAAPRAIRAASDLEAVLWASDLSIAPFSTPFELSASDGRIWIAPVNASVGQKEVFYFKGANWVRALHCQANECT